MNPGDIPRAFVKQAKELEQRIDKAKSEVFRLEVDLDDLKSSRLKPADYREALVKFSP